MQPKIISKPAEKLVIRPKINHCNSMKTPRFKYLTGKPNAYKEPHWLKPGAKAKPGPVPREVSTEITGFKPSSFWK